MEPRVDVNNSNLKLQMVYIYMYTMLKKQKEKRTYADRREYLKKAVANRRRVLKKRLVEHMGGKCMVCGYKKYFGALDFHHRNESEKSFGLSMNGITRSWEKTKAEAEKCVLLCANCHREVHGGVIKIPE